MSEDIQKNIGWSPTMMPFYYCGVLASMNFYKVRAPIVFHCNLLNRGFMDTPSVHIKIAGIYGCSLPKKLYLYRYWSIASYSFQVIKTIRPISPRTSPCRKISVGSENSPIDGHGCSGMAGKWINSSVFFGISWKNIGERMTPYTVNIDIFSPNRSNY